MHQIHPFPFAAANMQSSSRVYTDYERWVKFHQPGADLGSEPQYHPDDQIHQLISDASLDVNMPRADNLQQRINKRHDHNPHRPNLQRPNSEKEFLPPTACWAIAVMILAAALIVIRMRMLRT
ncbi:hypothetical protein BJX96DRAFT_144282 [Aspergillus floccosus]